MVFSKSFGYALRGIVYIAVTGSEKQKIQIEEIAETLGLPRYFLAKIMLQIVKGGILDSGKGYKGGFSLNDRTLKTTLAELINITGSAEGPDICALRLRRCDAARPCPMHNEVKTIRDKINKMLAVKTIGELLDQGGPDLIDSSSAY